MIESQMGVWSGDATAGTGPTAAVVFKRTAGFKRLRAGGRRATLRAREIGTTLLFISSPAHCHRNRLGQKHLLNQD